MSGHDETCLFIIIEEKRKIVNNKKVMVVKIQRCEQIIIKKSHPKFKVIDQQCFYSKNLYNEANYVVRQEFIKNKEYISYYDMNREFKTHENYKLTFSQPANCVMRLLDKNWKSYFRAIKDWKKFPSKYLSMPKPPKYLKKDGKKYEYGFNADFNAARNIAKSTLFMEKGQVTEKSKEEARKYYGFDEEYKEYQKLHNDDEK